MTRQIVAAFQGSVLVRFFTKFTKDIFASLIALIFIYEALKKLFSVSYTVDGRKIKCNVILFRYLPRIL